MAVGKFYKESGRFSPQGVAILFAGAVASGVLAGGIYGYLDSYNPFIYFNVLAWIFTMAVVAVSTAAAGRAGKVRNGALIRFAGLVGGATALYVSWITWIHATTSFAVLLVGEPQKLWSLIVILNKVGVWSIRSLKPSGVFLGAIWGLEALGFLVGTVGMATSPEEPFCEEADCWAGDPQRWPLAKLSIPERDALVKELEAGNYEALYRSPFAQGGSPEILEAVVYRCPTPAGPPYFLSLIEKVTRTNSDGNQETEEAPVLTLLEVPVEVYDFVQNPSPPASSPASET